MKRAFPRVIEASGVSVVVNAIATAVTILGLSCGSPLYSRSSGAAQGSGGSGSGGQIITGGAGQGGQGAQGAITGSGGDVVGTGGGGMDATGGAGGRLVGTGGAGTGGRGSGGTTATGGRGSGGSGTGGAATGGRGSGGGGGSSSGGSGTGGRASSGGAGGGGMGGGGGGGTTGDTARYSFELSSQGWVGDTSLTPFTTVATGTAQRFAGTASLAGTIAFAATGLAALEVSPPVPAIPAGVTVTFHVYVPTGALIDWVQPYVQEVGPSFLFTPTVGGAQVYNAGTWNTFTVVVPAGSISIGTVGVQFHASAAWAGTVYLDSVNY